MELSKKASGKFFLLSIVLTLSIFIFFTDKVFASDFADRQYRSETTLLDGNELEITIVAPHFSKSDVNMLIKNLSVKIEHLDGDLFRQNGFSDQLNRLGKGIPLELPADISDLLLEGIRVSSMTNSFFDIAAPSPKNIFTQRDWRRIVLDRNKGTVTYKSDRMKLDLTKIARAYYVDICIAKIRSAGFGNAKVSVGDISRVIGRDIFTPWNVGVNYGQMNDSSLARRSKSYKITSSAFATIRPDGLGRNVIDGKNKKPVGRKSMQSITVLAKEATIATSFALAIYVLGEKYGLKFSERNPGIEWIMVKGNGEVVVSEGLVVGDKSKMIERRNFEGMDRGPKNIGQRKEEEKRYE